MKKIFNVPKYMFYKFSKNYISWYEGFSYNQKTNGEEYLLTNLQPFSPKVIFDVGANIGDWSAKSLELFKEARIHCFEISASTFAHLQERFSREENVVLNQCGLGKEKGEILYKDYGVNKGVNTIITRADYHDDAITPEMKTTQILTGDMYCKNNKIRQIDILKIDVEGAEYWVLQGFSEMLSQGAIKVIQFEYGYTSSDIGHLTKDYYELLTGYGYEVGPLKPSGVLYGDFKYSLNDFRSGPNYVAVHSDYRDIINATAGIAILGFPK